MLLHLALVALVADALALLLCVLGGAREDPRAPRRLLIGVANPAYGTSEPGTPTLSELCTRRRSLDLQLGGRDSGALTLPLRCDGSGTLSSCSSFVMVPGTWGDVDCDCDRD